MATDSPNFYIRPEQLPDAVHHESFEKLWQTKWRFPAQLGVYPFMFGSVADFEPIVKEIKHMKEPYDWEAFASAFIPMGERLQEEAVAAEASGDLVKAAEYYLRASAVFRIGRFPTPRTPKQLICWEKSKETAFKGLQFRENPVRDIKVPFIFHSQDEPDTIPAAYCLPKAAAANGPIPLLIIVTGLDGYRCDLAVWAEGWANMGVAVLIHEIPGTGDCPADRTDPDSSDRLYDSILSWISTQPEIDQSRIFMWGFSTGGYHAIRAAHTHAGFLAGVVSQGGGCHYMFHSKWLEHMDRLEYPFDAVACMSRKFGYGDDVEAFKQQSLAKFSLIRSGILDRESCAPLLLVNGYKDEIFPIDDYLLLLERGGPKNVRLVQNEKHMGEPAAFPIILGWLYKRMGIVNAAVGVNDGEVKVTCGADGKGSCEASRRATRERQEAIQKTIDEMVRQQMNTVPFRAHYPPVQVGNGSEQAEDCSAQDPNDEPKGNAVNTEANGNPVNGEAHGNHSNAG